MEKKFYVMPEAEEIDLLMEAPLLADSDGTGDTTDQDAPILPGEGSTDDLG